MFVRGKYRAQIAVNELDGLAVADAQMYAEMYREYSDCVGPELSWGRFPAVVPSVIPRYGRSSQVLPMPLPRVVGDPCEDHDKRQPIPPPHLLGDTAYRVRVLLPAM